MHKAEKMKVGMHINLSFFVPKTYSKVKKYYWIFAIQLVNMRTHPCRPIMGLDWPNKSLVPRQCN